MGKGKMRESNMQNEIIEYDIALLPPRILATGFCVHMRLEFYLMPTGHNTYGSRGFY